MDRLGHQPITPGGLREGSASLQYCCRLKTSCLQAVSRLRCDGGTVMATRDGHMRCERGDGVDWRAETHGAKAAVLRRHPDAA